MHFDNTLSYSKAMESTVVGALYMFLLARFYIFD